MGHKIEDLHSITQSPADDHLGHAAQLLRQCAQREQPGGGLPSMADRRVATSCVLHAFFGLESLLNRVGYETFIDDGSPRHVPEDRRGFWLRRFLRNWNTSGVADKLQAVLDVRERKAAPANVLARLQEFNNLRNWLVHGFTYKTTFLLEPSEGRPDSYTVIDREDSVDWRSKFPNTGFNAPGELQYSDAATALSIVFEAVESLGEPVLLTLTEPKLRVKMFSPGQTIVAKLIDELAHNDADA